MVFIRGEFCSLCSAEIQPGEYVESIECNGKLRTQHIDCTSPDNFWRMMAASGRLIERANSGMEVKK